MSPTHVFPERQSGRPAELARTQQAALRAPAMKAKRWCAWLGTAALATLRLDAALHPDAPAFTQINQPIVVPSEVSNHVMFVSVMINGQGPFHMLVDTGCSFTIISPEVAAAVEARGMDMTAADEEVVNALGDTISTPRVVLDSIDLGGVQFEGVVAGVVPLEIQSKVDGRELDGLLGYTLFSDLFFAMDFPAQALVLSADWPKGRPPVRAELGLTEHSEVPFIKVALQGRQFEVMVDTGANDRLHLVPEELASLAWKAEPRPGPMLAVAGETTREQIGRLSGTLDVGGLKQLDPVVEIGGGTPAIGIGLLQPYCLVFHEAEDKLWLCSVDNGPIPSPPELSVGLSLLAEAAGWRVAGIIPNSPAEKAEISEGDLVTEIEGKKAPAWSRDQIQNWIDTHAILNLKLSTSAGERAVSLPVWTLVP
jgi:predicted aspartyl protease